METQTIKSTQQLVSKTGKNYWKVELVDSRVFNTFDKLIYDTATKNIGKVVNLEIIKNLKGYFEIQSISEGVAPNLAPASPQTPTSVKQDRDGSIIAQCLTKCVSEITASIVDIKSEEIGRFMKIVSCEVYKTYQNFLTQLQNSEVGAKE